MKKFILPLVIGVLLAGSVLWKYQNDVAAARKHYLLTSQLDTLRTRENIADALNDIYNELKVIATLPAVRALKPGVSLNTADYLTVQEMFNHLFEDTMTSELYIIPLQLGGGKILSNDVTSWRMALFDVSQYRPKISFEQRVAPPASLFVSADTIGLQRLAVLQRQVAWMRESVSRLEKASSSGYPARTDLLTEAAPPGASTEKQQRLLYSIPYYGMDAGLKGMVVAVIDERSISGFLFPPNYVIYQDGNGFTAVPLESGPWKLMKRSEGAPRANPDLIYSEVVKLPVTDASGQWMMWAGDSDDAFWLRADVRSDRAFAMTGVGASILLASSLVVFVGMMVKQRQMVIEKNIELGSRVKKRTAELKHALDKANQTLTSARISAEKYRMVFDNALDGIITTDGEGSIESFSAAAERIFGYSQHEMIGASITTLIPQSGEGENGTDIPPFDIAGEAKRYGKGPREITGRRHDGLTFPMELALSEMDLNGQRKFVAMVRDITARKKAEEALRHEK